MEFKTLAPNGPVLMMNAAFFWKPSGRMNLTPSAALMFLYKTITANPVKMSCAACTISLSAPRASWCG